ncbi:MAG: hypothetical protein GY777_30510 [Candidatus Brocadiaceae bacterium]|nr:hypothetical protein [Candidatus Brocadiaceae bacterium]
MLLLSLTGCSLFDSSSRQLAYDDLSGNSQSSKNTGTFDSNFEHVWASVIMSLGEMPLDKIEKEKGLIRTDWIEGLSEKSSRSVLTNRFFEDYRKERYRLTFTITGNLLRSSVKIRCQVQEKARGGSAAYRWERVKSTGEREEEALMRLEEILTEDKY